MMTTLEALFNEPERHYLRPQELERLGEYINTLPERLELYRQLRDQEIALMQPVADALEKQLPQESMETVKQGIKQSVLVLRYCAMAMLLDDPTLVELRLRGWLPLMIKIHHTQAVDRVLYSLLNNRLTEVFTDQQIRLISPPLQMVQNLFYCEEIGVG
ncbi:MAG: hypothetical protein QNJ46_13265 [Leptolyngbyaceae cyanobacterium MO_188.B28]|nr:hypothetical protein [Leptolyngbyaceae cyanobacterium MO_188.B28]